MFLMKIILAVVWALSIAYSVPYLVAYDLKQPTNSTAAFCMKTAPFDMEIYTIVNFFCLYAIPLLVMTALYSRIATVLWRSSDPISALARNSSGRNSTESRWVDVGRSPGTSPLAARDRNRASARYQIDEHHGAGATPCDKKDQDKTKDQSPNAVASSGSIKSTRSLRLLVNCKPDNPSITSKVQVPTVLGGGQPSQRNATGAGSIQHVQEAGVSVRERSQMSHKTPSPAMGKKERSLVKTMSRTQRSTKNPLIARRKIIRLLVSIVVCFAVCVLPHHVLWLQHYWSPKRLPSHETLLLPPITFFVFYLNSAINPFLYALLSVHFRHALADIFSSCFPSRIMTRHVSLTSLPASWKAVASAKGTRPCAEAL